MATTPILIPIQTPIPCPQCGQQVAIREELPQGVPALSIRCPHCGLGLVVSTTEEGN